MSIDGFPLYVSKGIELWAVADYIEGPSDGLAEGRELSYGEQ